MLLAVLLLTLCLQQPLKGWRRNATAWPLSPKPDVASLSEFPNHELLWSPGASLGKALM